MTGSFQRYLRAKRTVDDRALDRRLLDSLRDRLADRDVASDGPLQVVEIGAGIGTMLARFIEWDVLPAGDIHYTAVDIQSDNIDELTTYLEQWAGRRAIDLSVDDTLTLDGPDRHIELESVAADGVEYARRATGYDLLVGAALLDILDRSDLATLVGAVAPGGLYYFPITFDGATRFRPAHSADREVERYYHDHMDAKPGGSSRAGGDVLTRLQCMRGATLLDVAGSDWVVRPVDGAYPADEAFFLEYILDTIESAVGETAGDTFTALDDWLSRRRAQLATGELLYTTHQLDFLGRIEEP